MNESLDDYFHIEVEEHGHGRMDVALRFSNWHPWFKEVPYNQGSLVKEVGSYYFCSNTLVLRSGKEYRELIFPFWTGMSLTINENQIHMKKSAAEFMLMSWINHNREKNGYRVDGDREHMAERV